MRAGQTLIIDASSLDILIHPYRPSIVFIVHWLFNVLVPMFVLTMLSRLVPLSAKLDRMDLRFLERPTYGGGQAVATPSSHHSSERIVVPYVNIVYECSRVLPRHAKYKVRLCQGCDSDLDQ